MHSDGTATNFDSVQDKVIMLAAYLDGAIIVVEWKESHTNARATSEITAV
jgi:hypothetical protein